jgi:hypothetical protein
MDRKDDAPKDTSGPKERRTIPLTLFLQSFFIGSAFLIVLTTILLYNSFINREKSSVAIQVVGQISACSASRLSTLVSRLVQTAPVGLLLERRRAVVAMQAVNLWELDYAVMCDPSGSAIAFSNQTAFDVAAPTSNATMYSLSAVDVRSGLLSFVATNASIRNLGPTALLMLRACDTAINLTITMGVPLTKVSVYSPSPPMVHVNLAMIPNGTQELSIILAQTRPSQAIFCNSTTFPVTEQILSHGKCVAAASAIYGYSCDNVPEPGSSSYATLSSAFTSAALQSSAVQISAQVDSTYLDADVNRGTQLMVLISVAVGIVIVAACSLFVHVIIRGLIHVAEDMKLVARLELDKLRLRPSIFIELQAMLASLVIVAKKVKQIRDVLPREDENKWNFDEDKAEQAAERDGKVSGSMLESEPLDMAASKNFAELIDSVAVHTVRISVRYESRSTATEFASSTFDFHYAATDGDVFEKLVEECKRSCCEDEFQLVTIVFISSTNEHVLLRNSLQILEILSAAEAKAVTNEPSPIRLAMYKSTKPKVAVIVTSIVDVFNALATLVFVVRLIEQSVDMTALVAFCCLYLFALCMNCGICVALIRQGNQEDPKFMRWTSRSTTEVFISIIFSTLNLQNMELLWTGIRLNNRNGRTLLLFNAPPNERLVQRSISWSLFGFLFSDVAQILFKVWQVNSAGSNVEFSYFLALATSGLSVLFNLIFKMHAIFLWSGGQDDHSDKEGKGAVDDGQLVPRDISLVLVQGQIPGHVRQLSLRAVEWNQFYTNVFSTAKKFQAVPLMMHGGLVLLGLNVHKRSDTHEQDAVMLASQLVEGVGQSAHGVAVCVQSGCYLLGILGGINNKTIQALVPFSSLQRASMVAALAANAPLVVTRPVCNIALDVKYDYLPVGGTSTETSMTFNGSSISAVRPSQFFSSIRREIACTALEVAYLHLSHMEAPPPDVRSQQLAAALGLEESDRDRLEDRVVRILRVYRAWADFHDETRPLEDTESPTEMTTSPSRFFNLIMKPYSATFEPLDI